MASKTFSFKRLVLFFSRVLLKRSKIPKILQRNFSNAHSTTTSKLKVQRYTCLAQRSELSDHTLIFTMEGVLLKSSSLFPYFMLVAFEAGSLIRALLLFVLYPFICLVSEEIALKIMVMVCFFGIKEKSFRSGTAVLPKFLLEDVGLEIFEVLRRGGKRVGVSDLPQVMVESFLRDYLEIEYVVGRDLKVFCGYFVGLMEEKKKFVLEEMINQHGKTTTTTRPDSSIGISSFENSRHCQWFSHCKDIYLVSEGDRSKWHQLPKHKYPKPLIFHDGRLAFRPTPSATLAMFIWLPFGFTLAIARILAALTLPYNLSIPLVVFTGIQIKLSKHDIFPVPSVSKLANENYNKPPKGLLYVCNHRTLLDPLFISYGLKKPFTAVTYSLSRLSELLAPIRTVRLTRDRDQDAKMMEKLLSQGDLVVCPEGTTCREPYLLRFSPLFTELSHDIVPVAMDTRVSLFYGTTAGGFKFLDPVFFLMNPCPSYTLQFLDKVRGASICSSKGAKSKFDVANFVQRELSKALDFECTGLTRKDKYLTLAGNEGIVSS